MSKLKIGLSESNITPPVKFPLEGQFEIRISTYVESALYANICAVDSGEDYIIFCSLDLVQLYDSFINKINRKVKEMNADIDTSKIIYSTTHTHTGAGCSNEEHIAVVNGKSLSQANGLWMAAKYLPNDKPIELNDTLPDGVWSYNECGEYMSEIIANGVCEAWDKREEGFYGSAFGRAAIGHCRRTTYSDGHALMYGSSYSPDFVALEAGNDSGIELMYFFNKEKKPIGALVNVVCPSQVVESKCFVSSDYWGKARGFLKAEYGDDFVTLGLGGAGGDQSPRDLIRNPNVRKRRADPNMNEIEGAIELGKRVSSVVIDKLCAAIEEMTDEVKIINRQETVKFPLRQVSDSEYMSSKHKFDDYVKNHTKKSYDISDMVNLYILAGDIDRYHEQKTRKYFEGKISVALINDVAFAADPFELYLDYGNQIKARSNAVQTFIIQLANGNGGYLPTANGEKGSHYSAYVSSGYTGHEGGALLVERTLSLINAEVKDAEDTQLF